jgi:hypothetical protein
VSTALVGIVGALVGLLIGSWYTFWSTRRSELAEAVVAATVLAEELRTLQAGRRAKTAPDATRVQAAWDEHRSSIIRHMSPDHYRTLAGSVGREMGAPDPPSDKLIETMDALSDVFWKPHQAFIRTPTIDYLRGRTLSKRLRASIDSGLAGEAKTPNANP